MTKYPGPLGPGKLLVIVKKFGFQYRTLTGMLIFAVQIGCFDIAPTGSILCKFNYRPGVAHAKMACATCDPRVVVASLTGDPTGKTDRAFPRLPRTVSPRSQHRRPVPSGFSHPGTSVFR
jgi:hypothetical protein